MNERAPIHGEICRMPRDPLGYFGWPSVARIEDGTLVVGASGFRHAHICPWGCTTLFFSRDDGNTWSEPTVVHDSPLDDRDVGVVSLGGDKLLVTWFTLDPRLFEGYFESNFSDPLVKSRVRARLSSLTDAAVAEFFGSWTRLSLDGGKTFSPPRRAPVSSPHGPALLRDGRLMYLGKQFPSGLKRPFGQVAAAVSHDLGNSWEEIGLCPLPPGFDVGQVHEPHLVEMPDGRLVGALRVHEQDTLAVWQTESTDGGRTWSVPVRVPVNGAPPHLLLHSSGALVCSYGYRHEPYGQRVIFSVDQGRTWTGDMSLREDGPSDDLGYPATAELPDGSLFTVYYQAAQPGENASLLYTRWRLPKTLRA